MSGNRNNDRRAVSSRTNSPNDAEAIGWLLGAMGFNVTQIVDGSSEPMGVAVPFYITSKLRSHLPKYKTTLITILPLYPPLLALSTLLSYVLHGWPRASLVLLTVLLLVPTMTYFIMPWVTWLFRSWLYPKSAPVTISLEPTRSDQG